MNHLLCFGYGYSSSYIINKLNGFQIIATKREISENLDNLKLVRFEDLTEIPSNITHILISITPIIGQDIVYEKYYKQIVKLKNLKWLGYLSTTGVYGDHLGNRVTEESECKPTNERNINRANIEKKWLELHTKYDLPIHIFRLAGIYGPGRNPVERLQNGEDIQIINAPRKFFSRIHVEDIANIIAKSMHNPTNGEIYNLADDMPAEYSDVVEYSYELLGRKPTNYVNLEEANLSPMMQEFYQDNKKVSNEKIKAKLNIKLLYSTYRKGLGGLI